MERPAYYAARPGGWRDWWTILHPPYTAWHLSYVVIGACLAPHTNGTRLVATLLAFFFAVGIAAHALDELHGRPLQTAIPTAWLIALGAGGLLLACALGLVGVATVGPGLIVVHRDRPVARVGLQPRAVRRLDPYRPRDSRPPGVRSPSSSATSFKPIASIRRRCSARARGARLLARAAVVEHARRALCAAGSRSVDGQRHDARRNACTS